MPPHHDAFSSHVGRQGGTSAKCIRLSLNLRVTCVLDQIFSKLMLDVCVCMCMTENSQRVCGKKGANVSKRFSQMY